MTGLSSGELEPLEDLDLDLEDENQRQSTKYLSCQSGKQKRKGFSQKNERVRCNAAARLRFVYRNCQQGAVCVESG